MSRSTLTIMILIVTTSVLLTTALPADAAHGRRILRAIGFAASQFRDLRSEVADVREDMAALRKEMHSLQHEVGDVQSEVNGLNGEMDKIYADIEALMFMTEDMKVQMEETALGNEAMAEQIKANQQMIDMLKGDVLALWMEVQTNGGGTPGSCPPGASIREISEDGSVTCEIDGIGDYVEVIAFPLPDGKVGPGGNAGVSATCGDGRQPVTGGFVGHRDFILTANWPASNGWFASVVNTNPNPLANKRSFFVIARCAISCGDATKSGCTNRM